MTTSTLSHVFNVAYATEYKSIDLAVLIHHLQHWIHHNRRLNRNHHEGRTWMYDTLDSIAAHFPYWSRDQVNRLLRKAVKLKIIKKGNFNKTKFDRTVWYAFTDEVKFGIAEVKTMPELQAPTPSGEIAKSDMAKSPNGFRENATPIPHTKTDTKTDTGEAGASDEPQFTFGNKIKMPRKDLDALIAKHGGNNIKRYLELMSDYLAAHGKTYKDYAAALRQWIARDKKKSGADGIDEESNAHYAKKIAEEYSLVRAKQRSVRIEALNNRLLIESTHPTCPYPASEILYKENGFKDQVDNALRKWRLK